MLWEMQKLQMTSASLHAYYRAGLEIAPGRRLGAELNRNVIKPVEVSTILSDKDWRWVEGMLGGFLLRISKVEPTPRSKIEACLSKKHNLITLNPSEKAFSLFPSFSLPTCFSPPWLPIL